MRFLRYAAMLGVLMFLPVIHSPAQVAVGVGIGGPVYEGYGYAPPVCDYGYYDYAPYACAPYGYYGPAWFNSGIFIGVGPWFRGGYGYGYRGGYGFRVVTAIGAAMATVVDRGARATVAVTTRASEAVITKASAAARLGAAAQSPVASTAVRAFMGQHPVVAFMVAAAAADSMAAAVAAGFTVAAAIGKETSWINGCHPFGWQPLSSLQLYCVGDFPRASCHDQRRWVDRRADSSLGP